MTAAPFCGSPAALKAFETWESRLKALGVELGDADLYLVGVLAQREARLADLTARVEAEADPAARLRLVDAERRASVAFVQGLELLERAVGSRVGAAVEEEAVPVAAVAGGARVLAMPARPGPAAVKRSRSPLAGRLKGPEAVRQRILATLARGERLTRPELRKRVRGDETTFGRTLAQLVAGGEVKRSGSGVRGNPHRYGIGRSR